MKKILIILSVIFIIGCNSKRSKHYKYTIWVGSPTFGVGYYTDTFNIENGMIKYLNTEGKAVMHPENSVYRIEAN